MKVLFVAAISLGLAGCATGFGSPVDRDWRSQDYRLIGVTDGVETVLREGMSQYRCRALGREYHRKKGFPGWGVHEKLVCARPDGATAAQ